MAGLEKREMNQDVAGIYFSREFDRLRLFGELFRINHRLVQVAYERQISARLYRSGGNRIPEHTELNALVQALVADPWAVSYMRAETADRLLAVKIIGDL